MKIFGGKKIEINNLLARKIEEIYKIIKDQNKSRPRINITTKELLHY